jgi:hypothetical protein
VRCKSPEDSRPCVPRRAEAVAHGARDTSRGVLPYISADLTIIEIARTLMIRRYTLTLLSQMEQSLS